MAARIEQLRYTISSAKCGNFTWMCTTTDPSQNTIINNNVYILHYDYIFLKHQQEQKKNNIPIYVHCFVLYSLNRENNNISLIGQQYRTEDEVTLRAERINRYFIE